MRNLKFAGQLAAAALALSAGSAQAALGGPVTVGFNTLGASVTGRPNLGPTASGACPNAVPCYIESNVVFGAPEDPSPNGGQFVHVHSANYDSTNPVNKGLESVSDSSGIYVRIKDSSSFSLKSMRFYAPINASNPGSGSNDYWDILGYANAANPTVTTDSTVPVASTTVPNGFDGTVNFGSAFQHIGSFWIHYHGYKTMPQDPDLVLDPDTGEVLSDGPLTAKAFKVVIDNVTVSAPVPVPAAAWLFGSGLAGLLSLAKRKKTA